MAMRQGARGSSTTRYNTASLHPARSHGSWGQLGGWQMWLYVVLIFQIVPTNTISWVDLNRVQWCSISTAAIALASKLYTHCNIKTQITKQCNIFKINTHVFIEWEVVSLNSRCIVITFLFDWISLIFMGFVFFLCLHHHFYFLATLGVKEVLQSSKNLTLIFLWFPIILYITQTF